MADLTFAQFVERLHEAQVKNFWGEIRLQKAGNSLPAINDLGDVSPEQVKALSARTVFSVADLEAGYRALCVAAEVEPAWPPRIYP